jgi:hypothetical protein
MYAPFVSSQRKQIKGILDPEKTVEKRDGDFPEAPRDSFAMEQVNFDDRNLDSPVKTEEEHMQIVASYRENFIDDSGSEYLMGENNDTTCTKTPRDCFPATKTYQANMLEKALDRLK